ncbi:alpha/beta hydrolase [Flavobacterium sp. RSP46]|uniref:alpha/beta fold hydrolase n=1 Tax=Flavobacterium sp. RSP46 TaxID=2497486 RepID=UPI000F884FAF|nr:alpha/beta hydrolase [Flavobacterium sp. RSP46]RTY89760.1 alpha/beta hydrolase [Flavobacterium sp. RSP46]
MTVISVNKIDIDYKDSGRGEVLVFLHGLGSTKKDWDFQVPFFSNYYRVICLDLRGHGKTSIPINEFGVEYMSEDVIQLLDALGIDKFTPIGYSMGGAVAFQLAYSYPERINNLVIVNSGPDFNKMGKIGEELIANRTAFLKMNGLDALANEIANNMFPEPQQVDFRRSFEERIKQNSVESYYNSFITLMNWGLGDKIKSIKARTLIVASDMDYTPVSFKEDYSANMQNAKLKVIKNSRHGIVVDQWEAFNQELYNFLSHE